MYIAILLLIPFNYLFVMPAGKSCPRFAHKQIYKYKIHYTNVIGVWSFFLHMVVTAILLFMFILIVTLTQMFLKSIEAGPGLNNLTFLIWSMKLIYIKLIIKRNKNIYKTGLISFYSKTWFFKYFFSSSSFFSQTKLKNCFKYM